MSKFAYPYESYASSGQILDALAKSKADPELKVAIVKNVIAKTKQDMDVFYKRYGSNTERLADSYNVRTVGDLSLNVIRPLLEKIRELVIAREIINRIYKSVDGVKASALSSGVSSAYNEVVNKAGPLLNRYNELINLVNDEMSQLGNLAHHPSASSFKHSLSSSFGGRRKHRSSSKRSKSKKSKRSKSKKSKK